MKPSFTLYNRSAELRLLCHHKCRSQSSSRPFCLSARSERNLFGYSAVQSNENVKRSRWQVISFHVRGETFFQTCAGIQKDMSPSISNFQKDPRIEEVYEKLIELYRSRDRKDWKKLITISTKWPEMADGVFER